MQPRGDGGRQRSAGGRRAVGGGRRAVGERSAAVGGAKLAGVPQGSPQVVPRKLVF